MAVFISACLAGNLLCLVYSALMVFRRLVRHSLFWISMEDIMFWVMTGIYLFSEMYRTCNGSIRWYFVVGVLAGGFSTIWIAKNSKKGIAKLRKRE